MGSSWSHFTESPQGRLSVVHFLVCPSNKNCYNNVTFAGQKSLVTATICEHIFQPGFLMINSDLFPLEVDSHSLWRMTSLSFNFHREGQPWPRWCFSNWVAVIQIKACIFSTPSLAHHPQQEAETSLLFFDLLRLSMFSMAMQRRNFSHCWTWHHIPTNNLPTPRGSGVSSLHMRRMEVGIAHFP